MYADHTARGALQQLRGRTRQRLEAYVAATVYYEPIRHEKAGVTFEDLEQRVLRKFHAAGVCALPALIDHLLADGVFRLDGRWTEADEAFGWHPRDHLRLVHARPGTAGASKAENAAAYRRSLAARVGGDLDPAQRDRLAELFRRCRQAGRVVDTGTGTLAVRAPNRPVRFAVAVPDTVLATDQGVHLTATTVFALLDSGPALAFAASGERIAVDFPDDDVCVTVDLHGLAHSRRTEERSVLLPYAKLQATDRCSVHVAWEEVEQWLGFTLSPRGRRVFEKALERGRRRNLTLAAALLRRAVDPEVVRYAARLAVRRVSMADYSHFAPDTARLARYRRQACDAYPLLSWALRDNARLRQAVDDGAPLNDLLATVTGVRPAILRRIARLHWQRAGMATARSLCEGDPALARVLNACPVERLPVGRRDWQGLRRLADFLRDAETAFDDGAAAAAVQTLSRRWYAVALDWERVSDMLSDLTRQLSAALWRHPAVFGTGVAPWLVRKTVRQFLALGAAPAVAALAERTDRWHDRLNELHRQIAVLGARSGAASPPTSWPPLDAPFTAPGLGTIRWLTTPGDLEAESELMDHCVRTYDAACLYEGSHIGAVSGAAGGRATVELRAEVWYWPTATDDAADDAADDALEDVAPRGVPCWKLRVAQHYGVGNRPVAEDCNAVLAAFLASRQAQLDYAGLETARAERARHRPDWGDEQRFSDEDPAQCQAVIELYRPFLPREAARLDRDGLARLLRARIAEENGLSLPDWEPPLAAVAAPEAPHVASAEVVLAPAPGGLFRRLLSRACAAFAQARGAVAH